MSSGTQSLSADKILIDDVYLSIVAPYSLLYYDYILTFPTEVERFWNTAPKFTVVSVLYIANRVLALGALTPILVINIHSGFKLTNNLCHRMYAYHQSIEVAMQAVVAALFIMRVYALYDRSRKILVYYAIALCVCGSVSVWALVRSEKPDSSQDAVVLNGVTRPYCDTPLPTDQSIGLACAWATMLLLDISVFVQTLVKALQFRRIWNGVLLGILLRDGTLYFGILVVMNTVNVSFLIVGQPALKANLTTVINSMSSILVARLMLNLRDPKIRGNYQPHTHGSPEPVIFDESISAREFDMSWLSASAYGHDRPPDHDTHPEYDDD